MRERGVRTDQPPTRVVDRVVIRPAESRIEVLVELEPHDVVEFIGTRASQTSSSCFSDRSPQSVVPAELFVDLSRLGLGVSTELAFEKGHTPLVLTQGGGTPAELRVETHERPVDRLLQWVDGDHSQRRLERRLYVAFVALMGKELGHGLEGLFAKPLALSHEPVLELVGLARQSLEEVTSVQRNALLERGRRSVAHELLKGHGVDIDRLGKRHGVAVQPETCRIDRD
jgi:hypothetical protein